ncbi:MAG: hypothetical protein FWG55_06305 [Candidatus Bathyarchaeota archaeon]|nr:hypothetical protein [Candidatus Termiticorpusculum sp.]
MFKQQNKPILSLLSPEIQKNGNKHHRVLYVAFAVLAVLIVIIVAALLIPQNEIPQSDSSPRELSLNYAVGERMVYENTNIATTQMTDTTLSLPDTITGDSSNSTLIIEVLSENSDSYTVKQTGTMTPDLGMTIPPLTRSIDKASYYNNFVEPQGQFIFYNADSNPALLAYLAQDKITIGDVWNIPVNTGTASLGLTGEVTLKFVDTQEINVPAGTFQTMRIEVTSNGLSYHSDGTILSGIDGMNLQINGTSYVELGTFRLIKADLTQIGNGSTILYSERTLVEYTKP